VLRRGKTLPRYAYFDKAGIFAFARQLNKKEMITVINSSTEIQTLSINSGIKTIYPKGTKFSNLLDPLETLTVSNNQTLDFSIRPFGAKILIPTNEIVK
jgi:hypothetical protein